MSDTATDSDLFASSLTAINLLQDSATRIVEAYLSHNALPVDQIPTLVSTVYLAVLASVVGTSDALKAPAVERPSPAKVRASIQHDHLVSFENGKSYKALGRHLRCLGLSPADYRAKWGLPANYPMTSAAYSERRSQIAKEIGLGRKPANTLAA